MSSEVEVCKSKFASRSRKEQERAGNVTSCLSECNRRVNGRSDPNHYLTADLLLLLDEIQRYGETKCHNLNGNVDF